MAKKNMDEALVNAYIGTGDKVDKLKDGSFSWCAFFFGPFYFMYRKMLGLGVAILLLDAIIELLSIPRLVVLLIYIIEGVLFGVLFKKLYVMHAEKQVEKIKNSNSTKTDEEIIALCAKHGNPSVGMAMLGLLVFVVLLYLLATLITIIDSNSKYQKFSNNLQESLDVEGNIEFGVPEGFEKEAIMEGILPVYSYSKDNSNCTLTVDTNIQSNGDTAKSVIEGISLDPGDSMGDITTQTVNGVEWSKVQVTGQSIYGNVPTYDYYYVTVKNNKVYKVHYSIYGDEAGVCASVQEDIVNSLKIKR